MRRSKVQFETVSLTQPSCGLHLGPGSSPSELFAAYVDPMVREVWAALSPTAEVKIDECDVRTAGHEIGRCGSEGDLRWTMKIAYHLVVPDRHICLTEELREDDQLLTVALITFDIETSGQGSKLKLTDQIASLVGQGGISGHREGYAQALDNLRKVGISILGDK